MPTPDHMVPLMIRLLHRAVGVIALTVLLFAAEVAQAVPFAFETTPGKLPKNVLPIHYALDLRPNLDKLSVSGSVAIDIEVREPTDRIVLNARDMKFASATIDRAVAARDIGITEGSMR